MSFDHALGKWIVVGTMTAMDRDGDGRAEIVEPDAGVGIRAPGWHGQQNGKCAEAAIPDYLLDQGRASQVATGTFDTYDGVNTILDNFNKDAKTNLPPLPKSLGNVFSAINIFRNLDDAFDSTKSRAERVKAGSTALLSLALLGNPKGLVFTIGRIAATALAFDSAATGLANVALGIERKVTDYQCKSSTDEPSPFSIMVSNGTFTAGALAGTQEPILQEIRLTLDDIATILSDGRGDELNMGLTAQQVSRVQGLLHQLNGQVTQFDSQTPFWIATETVFRQVEPVASGSSGGTSAHVLRGPRQFTSWSVDVSGQTIRGVGPMEIIAPNGVTLDFIAYNSKINAVASVTLETGAGTAPVTTNEVAWQSVTGFSDLDGDGLVDNAERAVGTILNNSDSDEDGINDFDEVRQGLNPLDNRGFPTGVIANLPLMGEAKEVVVEGSPLDANEQIAYVATGSHGLAIVDASQFICRSYWGSWICQAMAMRLT